MYVYIKIKWIWNSVYLIYGIVLNELMAMILTFQGRHVNQKIVISVKDMIKNLTRR